VFDNVVVQPRDAREASDVFYRQRIGDVLLTYENEVVLTNQVRLRAGGSWVGLLHGWAQREAEGVRQMQPELWESDCALRLMGGSCLSPHRLVALFLPAPPHLGLRWRQGAPLHCALPQRADLLPARVGEEGWYSL
jgi:hypothetical protein